MIFEVLLNTASGSLRDRDSAELEQLIRNELSAAGHEVFAVHHVDRQLIAKLENVSKGPAEIILVCGGDGTVSAAASVLWKTDKVLAILPGGTMNLSARAWSLPLDIDECIAQLATGVVDSIDIATVDGRPFVHQIAFGFHARAIETRNKMTYWNRLSKMFASVRAILRVVRQPPSFRTSLKVEGELVADDKFSALSVTNNPFGEGHLPYAENPISAQLGIYSVAPVGMLEAVVLVLNTLRGKYRASDAITVRQGTSVELNFRSRWSMRRALVDGELVKVNRKVSIKKHARALNVWLPKAVQ